SGPIESGVKHLLGSVVWAMMSPGASIVASLKNVNGFLAVYTPSDDLICIDFKKKGVVPEVMLHILEEFVFLLGRHSLNNEIPRMAMMSPGGSIVASLENVNGFLAVYTPSDDLIRTDFEKKGVVPEIMLHILEEFVFMLGRHSIDNKIPRMIVCKVGKQWGT
nr:hypothetical protein [Tanacetum cinerariifolium]